MARRMEPSGLRPLIGIVREAAVAAFSDRHVCGCLGKWSAEPIDNPTFRDLNRVGDRIDCAPVQAGKALHLPILTGKDEFSHTSGS